MYRDGHFSKDDGASFDKRQDVIGRVHSGENMSSGYYHHIVHRMERGECLVANVTRSWITRE